MWWAITSLVIAYLILINADNLWNAQPVKSSSKLSNIVVALLRGFATTAERKFQIVKKIMEKQSNDRSELDSMRVLRSILRDIRSKQNSCNRDRSATSGADCCKRGKEEE